MMSWYWSIKSTTTPCKKIFFVTNIKQQAAHHSAHSYTDDIIRKEFFSVGVENDE